jgi:general nucleoside transport system ATP-binding protein
VLSPQEIIELFTILRRLKSDGHSIIFISHKLKEVMEISDRVTVLRRGKHIVTTNTAETSPTELARQMIGQELPKIQREIQTVGDTLLRIHNLKVIGNQGQTAVDGCSLEVRRGEIVGIAGVDGNGQIELAEAIMGLRRSRDGKIQFKAQVVTDLPPDQIRRLNYGYIPEDRQAAGLILNFTIAENAILNAHRLRNYRHPAVPILGYLERRRIDADADELIKHYDVRTTDRHALAKSLSGGNQQKVVIARELSQSPDLLLAVNPTRGLDISATDYVHQRLLEQRRNNRAVLLISTELDEVLALSDRLFVMYNGKLTEATTFREDLSRIGLLMTGER